MKMIAVIDEKFNKPIAVEMCMALRMKLEKHCGSSCDMRLYRAKEDIHSRRMSEIQSDLWLLLSECYVDDFDSLCNEDKHDFFMAFEKQVKAFCATNNIPMEEQVLACAAGQYYLTFEMKPDEFCRLYDRAGIWRTIFSDFYTERQVINGLDTAKEIPVRKMRTH